MSSATMTTRRPIFSAFSARIHWMAAGCCALALAFAIVAIIGVQSARSATNAPPIAFSHTTTHAAPGNSGMPEAPRV